MEEIIELIKTDKYEQGISLLQYAAYCRNFSAIDLLKRYKPTLDFFEAA
jgi:hypothetical protein